MPISFSLQGVIPVGVYWMEAAKKGVTLIVQETVQDLHAMSIGLQINRNGLQNDALTIKILRTLCM